MLRTLHFIPLASLVAAALFFAPAIFAVTEKEELALGQLLIVGFKGTHLSEGLAEVIKETKPGGILLFGRNVKSAEQVAQLTFSAQNLSKKVSGAPLLIAIDQEGGNVIRIRHKPPLPSALAIAKTRDLTVAKRSGLATGRLLRSLGININLAPVADVSNPDTDHFLGTRSFGDNPKRVATMATAVAMGLQESGVMPIAKHFPGHGDASGDSHLIQASSPLSRDELNDRDLVPYFALAKYLRRPWGAMLAHVTFPKIDDSGVPATFSKPIVTGIFRQDISQNSLVMTDDIEMAGANSEKNIGLRAVRAIEAGADMVMIAWSRKIQKEVTTALRDALQSGRLKRSRVEEALRRIATAREAYVPRVIKLATKEELTRSLNNPEFTMLGNAVLRAAARNLDERRPASAGELIKRKASRPVIVLSARMDFLEAFRKRAKGHHVLSVLLKPSRTREVEELLMAHPDSPIFAYVSGSQVAKFMSSLDDEIAKRLVIVNVETRAMFARPERFRDVFDVHFRHPELGTLVAESYLELPDSKPQRTAASQQSEQTE